MSNSGRTIAGFCIAPVVPGVLLYIYGLAKGQGVAAIVGPLLLIPLAYCAALLVGIPVFRRMERKGARRLQDYIFTGGIIGAVVDLVPNLPSVFGGQPIPFGEICVATIYAMISAAAFWGLAVRSTED